MNRLSAGIWEIWFIGERESMTVRIKYPVENGAAFPLYLVGIDETIYNWSTIKTLKKIDD